MDASLPDGPALDVRPPLDILQDAAASLDPWVRSVAVGALVAHGEIDGERGLRDPADAVREATVRALLQTQPLHSQRDVWATDTRLSPELRREIAQGLGVLPSGVASLLLDDEALVSRVASGLWQPSEPLIARIGRDARVEMTRALHGASDCDEQALRDAIEVLLAARGDGGARRFLRRAARDPGHRLDVSRWIAALPEPDAVGTMPASLRSLVRLRVRPDRRSLMMHRESDEPLVRLLVARAASALGETSVLVELLADEDARVREAALHDVLGADKLMASLTDESERVRVRAATLLLGRTPS